MIINNKIKSNYDWFTKQLNDNFELDTTGKSKVIFGYNGIGKTTLFKIIKENEPNIEFLSYEDISPIVKEKNTLAIYYNSDKIDKTQSDIQKILGQLEVKTLLKNNINFKTAKDVELLSKELSEARKQNALPALKLDIKELFTFSSKYTKVLPQFLGRVYKLAVDVSNIKDELQSHLDNKLHNALLSINNCIGDTDTVCPVCDSNVPNLKKTVEKKLEKKAAESKLIKDLINLGVSDSENIVGEYVSAAGELNKNKELFNAYFLSGGNDKIYQNLLDSQCKLSKLKKDLDGLRKEAEEKFRFLQSKRDPLKKDLMRYFKLSENDIVLDDKNYIIEIKFPRNIENYSTGEINLICFLYQMYSFLGGYKDTLVLDDPASSFDLVNHYKIAYEIVKNCKEKNLLVLTHSSELVNAISSQYQSVMDYFYLDKINGEMIIEKIEGFQINDNPNVITIDKLDKSDGFVEALKNREENQLFADAFHYSVEEKRINTNPNSLSNHQMVQVIENFKNFSHVNFLVDTLTKIKYLCYLRVWIESRIYKIIENNENAKNEFNQHRSLSKRIDLIKPKDDSDPFSLNKFTREDLMSKKVMLNQNIHYNSQIAPMAYAMNLSCDQIAEEINEIKKLFD